MLCGIFPLALLDLVHIHGVNNCKGIALLGILCKLFTKYLCARLIQFYTVNNLFFEEQAGFRRGGSTIDKVFVPQS